MTNRAVEIIEVSKNFGSTLALNGVSLTVGRGEFFSLLGPSGCGKTTLLRMIAGFEEPTCGRIVVSGDDMSFVPAHKRPVNLVFQNYALFPHLNVFENVAFGLKAKGLVGHSEIPKQVRSALELVRLESYADYFPAQLSGGQQQRVALARAFINRPTVLLLDEPLSALDSKIREQMQEELAQFQRKLGITFVMVTHDQTEALALSDRMAVFNKGNLEQVGTPEDIFNRPSTPFVADFIGQNNLFVAYVQEWSNQFAKVLIGETLTLWVTDDRIEIANRRQQVTVWFRTHSLRLFASQEEAESAMASNTFTVAGHASSKREQAIGPSNCFEAQVTHRSYQGANTDYHLKVKSKLDLRASTSEAEQRCFKVGDTVFIVLSACQAAILPHGTPEDLSLPVPDCVPNSSLAMKAGLKVDGD